MAIQYLDRARVAYARSQIDSFVIALESCYIDCGRYTTAEQGLDALWKKPVVEPVNDGWTGPCLYKKTPNDPWGNAYEYLVPGKEGMPFSIVSFGSDGKEGGEGKDAGINSWEN